MMPLPRRSIRRPRPMKIAALVILVALSACSRAGNQTELGGDAMDNNMAAMAEQMEATANNRADAMAGGMMDDAANGMASDTDPTSSGSGNGNAASPEDE